jgi:hypothetical protein
MVERQANRREWHSKKWCQKRRDTRGHGDEAGGMDTPRHPYHVLLFINGRQCGDNRTFVDWYADDEAAVADARDYFTSEGYQVDEVTVSVGEVCPANDFMPALHGRLLTIRLTHPPKHP